MKVKGLCRPTPSRSIEGLRSLASKVNALDKGEISAAQYLLKLAEWYESEAYANAKEKRMANKHRTQPKENENESTT